VTLVNISVSGQSNSFFDSAYRETAPWDIGEPQPAMLALLDEYPPTGPVLDVGCGAGALTFALARRDLAAALREAGGRYYLLCFAFDSPIPNAPRQVRESELRARFAPELGWRILALRPARFLTRSTRGDVPAIAACIERVPVG
jgi:hypothetical protein